MILLQPSETAESETGAMNELNNMLVRELVLLPLVYNYAISTMNLQLKYMYNMHVSFILGMVFTEICDNVVHSKHSLFTYWHKKGDCGTITGKI